MPRMTEETAVAAEVTDLLQHLIRNACVNDGTPSSGHEIRSADLLEGYLEGPGLDLESYDARPGRRSLVARIEGRDPEAPTLCLMGHTDVVPVTAEHWSRDPFAGEVVDGEVWGRGAVDMLNLTASMAVAVRRLARSGYRPEGTLVYLAVADEEAGGINGAEWLTRHQYDAIRADYVLTESGGIHMPTAPGDPARLNITVAEKGVAWRRLVVTGTPGHGSMPFGADNALVKAAEVVRRLVEFRPRARITEPWRAYAGSLGLPPETVDAITDPARVWDACHAMADRRTARIAHASTHMSFSPNVISGGVKTNVIPDEVEIEVDVRVLPGETEQDVSDNIAAALGDLAPSVEVGVIAHCGSTASPVETPLWDVLERVAGRLVPGAGLVPRLTAGGTDARFYREKGAVAYGFGLFSPAVTFQEFASRFHGNDERVDIESLRLSTELWLAVATEVLGG
ncbi:MAG TPA: M20/M25/M40 family metallo-hydrolase [Acidimicrobiales bacterium]|nr:M20/M25/M40 family metallo-hydrolase [Acidimicrobiales bacterium]